MKQVEFLYVVGGILNGTNNVEKSLAVLYKANDTLTMQPNHSTPTYLPKRNKMCFHTKTCKLVIVDL